jgi:hypothetical protein
MSEKSEKVGFMKKYGTSENWFSGTPRGMDDRTPNDLPLDTAAAL